MMNIIYCANGNKRMAKIAIDAGFQYGGQLPGTLHFQPYFVDQNWKCPEFPKYLREIKRYKPSICTVLDWERAEQRDEVFMWAEEIAPYTNILIIIPKIIGSIPLIPSKIGNTPTHLGYATPTKHGKTDVPLWEFGNRPVHLLGGSPKKQLELSYYLNVKSLDGNMHQMVAIRYCKFWNGKRWISIKESDGQKWNNGGKGAYEEAFYRSCINILKGWKKRGSS